MESEKHQFKVLIVGGSITGLALANMLEQLGIDFLLLESYPEIAPRVGASIGFHPNGCRILDQIGCYDGVRAKLDDEIKEWYYNCEGKTLGVIPFFGQHLIERHGYGILFLERQLAIEVFYGNLKNKSSVLVNKRAVSVQPDANGVSVTTQDGSTYSGDILVGADGVHSTIWKEMWRLGEELSPGRFPQSDRTDIPCDYLCMYGISEPVPGFTPSSVQNVMGNNNSHLVIDGLGGRIYWFLFVKNQKTLRGVDNIPRSFSAEERKTLAEKHWDDLINEKVKFGDLYEKHTSAILTSVPEFVYTKWHLGRIIALGDAVHKLNPIGGQGGNNALETAAAVATELHTMLVALPKGERPSDADVAAAFERTQTRRRDHVLEAVDVGHQTQRLFSRETPFFALLARLVPVLDPEGSLGTFADRALPARRLPMLPMPQRPRFEPFHDELPARPLGGLAFSMLLAASVFGGLLYVAVNDLNKAFLDSRSGAAVPLPSMYLLPVLLIWTVEGYRNASTYTFVSFPVFFGIAAQVWGIATVAPLYFLLSVWTSGRAIYGRAAGRPVPLAVAQTILPAAFLGYLVPVILAAAAPSSSPPASSLWQHSLPVLLAFHVYAAKRLLEHYTPPGAFDMYKNADVAPLRDAFRAAFGLALFAHASTVYRASAGLALPTLLSPSLLLQTALQCARADPDFALFALTTALWSLFSVYELRRTGWATTRQAACAVAAVLAGQVLVGPVATYTGLWYWREGVWAGKANLQGRKD
ncbi:FAD binding domain-containing protein [Mycena polygramma]|nr:FAD binding domain-containing protein [Mycena polygramma]